MGALMRENDPVLIRLKSQGGDQVPARPPAESDLMDVHRSWVRLQDAVPHPGIEGSRRTFVIRAGPDEADDVVWR
jgi:hypothetical protein